MGTHPIFESDFDCLTEFGNEIEKKKMLRHIIRRSLSTSIPRTKIITTHPFQKPRENDERWSVIVEDEDVWTRYEDEVDVAIVGGGPSGLAAAIRLKQLANDAGLDEDFRVCVIEKAANIGDHILSGACLETKALDELIPDWKERGAPLHTPVKEDEFHIMPRLFGKAALPK